MKIVSKRTRTRLLRELSADSYGIYSKPRDFAAGFLDIGACVGTVALQVRLCHPGTRVFCVEPDPGFYECLVDNLAELDIEFLNAGLGKNGDFLEIQHGTSLAKSYRASSIGRIPAMPLSRLVDVFGVAVEKLWIKFDCEGAEHCLVDDRESLDILQRCLASSWEMHSGPRGRARRLHAWFSDFLQATHHEVLVSARASMVSTSYIRKL